MKYGETAGVLKPLDEVVLPDPRWKILVLVNQETGTDRPFDISDLHRRLSLTKLNSKVPADVQTHFQTALNLMLYAWFVFEFQTVAEKQAYASLEFALRLRFPEATATVKKKGKPVKVAQTLAPLLQRAFQKGLIIPEKLPAWERVKATRKYREKDSPFPLGPMPTPKQWIKQVLEIIPRSRNDLAHGSSKLFWESSFWSLEFCADVINAIYPETNAAASHKA